MIRRRLAVAAVAALILAPAAARAQSAPASAPPAVVVSIKPIHSLAAQVMDGVGTPTLLLETGADPHTYSLKPSDAEALAKARLVVWSSHSVETFMERPVAALAGKARVVRLDREKSLKLHRVREGKAWEHAEHDEKEKKGHGHGHGHGHSHGHSHGAVDGHLWLDPDNAVAIVRVLVRELSALDKRNAAKYAANGETAITALRALDAELARALAPLKGRRFVVAHDSTQYFERKYQLTAVGSISISPERPPSAQRLHELRTRIKRDNVVCVFGEPQHPDTLVKTVIEGTGARTGTLDTDGGIGVAAGRDAYAAIMRNLAKALAACLAPAA
jgi:zinc transport system substrate-binding protein